MNSSDLLDVDKRFDLAYCYRTLLKQSLFSAPTEASNTVQNEIRGFIRHRLGVLMGVSEDNTYGQTFSKQELLALKALATKIISNSELAEEPTPQSTEVPKQATVQANSTPSKKEPKKKLKKEVSKKQKAEFEPPLESEPYLPETAAYQAPEGTLASDGKYYHEGQVIEEDGQKFRIKIQEVEGKKYVLRQNVTPQAIPSNRMPMPNASQMEQLSRQQALDSLQNLGPLGLTAVEHLTQVK